MIPAMLSAIIAMSWEPSPSMLNDSMPFLLAGSEGPTKWRFPTSSRPFIARVRSSLSHLSTSSMPMRER